MVPVPWALVMPDGSGLPASFGRFTVKGYLGSGGMADVFVGSSRAGDRVAIKVIKSTILSEMARARFAQEITSVKTVFGPRLAPYFGADPLADHPWLATGYIPGPTLKQHVDDVAPLPEMLVASLGSQLAEALGIIHVGGLTHRDLSVKNIILSREGPVVIDFGLAALAEPGTANTQNGLIIGSVHFMAPEQIEAPADVTAAADIYSLGAVLLFAATGHYAYQGGSRMAVLNNVANPDVPPDLTGLPAGLAPTVAAMLALDLADRPSLEDVTDAFVSHIEASGQTRGHVRRQLIATTATSQIVDDWDSGETPADDEEALGGVAVEEWPVSDPPWELADDLEQDEPAGAEEPEPEPVDGHVQDAVPEEAKPVPTSRRVGEDLRRRYARQSTL